MMMIATLPVTSAKGLSEIVLWIGVGAFVTRTIGNKDRSISISI